MNVINKGNSKNAMRHTEHNPEEPQDASPEVKIDVERMAFALASETVHVPPNLSREEMLKFILATASGRRNG